MYDRARGYCLRALEVRHPGCGGERCKKDPKAALATMTRADVPALYWTGVAWGGGCYSVDNPFARIGELATVRALLTRSLELDEAWEGGTIHEAMIAVESLPVLLGGSPVRAREHFDRAVALSNGESAFAYVALATGVAQPAKDRREFERAAPSGARRRRLEAAVDPAGQSRSRRSARATCCRRPISCSKTKVGAGSELRLGIDRS